MFSVAALEPESDSAYGRDVARASRVVSQFAPEPGDVHVEGLRGTPPVGVPHLAHDLLTGDDLAGVAYEDAKQVELLGRELQLLVAHPGAPGFGVDPHT